MFYDKTSFETAKSKEPIKCTCTHCGSLFNMIKSTICTKIKHNSTEAFCSTQCFSKHRTKKRVVVCAYCNKPITVSNVTYEKSKSKKFFCNHSCSASYNNSLRTLSEETKEKISNTIKTQNTSLDANITKCKYCGKENCNTPHICNSEFIHIKSKNLSKLGFDLSKIGSTALIEEYQRIKQILEKFYIDELYSIPMIKDKFEFSDYRTVYSILKFFNIKTRSRSEARKVSILTKRSSVNTSPKYKHGYHTTWDNKIYYYRSSYEEDYMVLLDDKKIEYDYEPFRIKYFDSQKNKIRIAIPDFYIPKSNTIVEVKSKYTYNKVNMIDKANEYKKLGYNFILVLEHKEYDFCI